MFGHLTSSSNAYDQCNAMNPSACISLALLEDPFYPKCFTNCELRLFLVCATYSSGTPALPRKVVLWST